MKRDLSRRLGTWLVASVLVASGCSTTESKDTDQEVGCAMLSRDSLTALFGKTNLRSSGALGTKASRQEVPAHCEISDKDTGTSLLRITVSDARDARDATRQAAAVRKEAAALTQCQRKDSLGEGGYACFDEDGVVAAMARDERLIRVTLPRKDADSINTARIADLIEEINGQAEEAP